MGKHVIVGAGQVGGHLVQLLLAQGHDVTVITRSGSGPEGVRKVAANATDKERLIEATRGADALYNCMNPRYHEWEQVWPPASAALLGAAEATGAVLVTLGNLYGYGPVDGPMTEDLPLATTGHKGRIRAKMWDDMLASHQAGRARVTEVRASDFYGPGTSDQAYIGTTRFVRPLLAGKRAAFLSDPTIRHSWTYVLDAAEALAVAGADERAWGRAWHIPTVPAFSAQEFGERLCKAAGAPAPRINKIPGPVFYAMGVVNPMMRELRETQYQFERPYILDSTAFQTTFGTKPTSLDDALEAIIAAA